MRSFISASKINESLRIVAEIKINMNYTENVDVS